MNEGVTEKMTLKKEKWENQWRYYIVSNLHVKALLHYVLFHLHFLSFFAFSLAVFMFPHIFTGILVSKM